MQFCQGARLLSQFGLSDYPPIPIMDDLELRAVDNFLHRLEPVFKRREKGVALHHALDQCEVQIRATWQRLLINLRAAADEDFSLKILRVDFCQRPKNPYLRALRLVEPG